MNVRIEELRTVNVIDDSIFVEDGDAHRSWLKRRVVSHSYIRYRGFDQLPSANLGYSNRAIWVDPHIAGWNSVVNGRRVLNEERLATVVCASKCPLDNQPAWAMALELNRVG